MSAVHLHPISLPLQALREVLAAHYARLSAASRRLRFMGGTSDRTIDMIASKARPELVIGIEADGSYRGILEIFRIERDRVEISLSVEDEYQGRGFGRSLFQQGISHAKKNGVSNVDIFFSRSNRAIRKLCVEAGGTIRSNGPESIARIRIAREPRIEKGRE